jgi:hypothetical protein
MFFKNHVKRSGSMRASLKCNKKGVFLKGDRVGLFNCVMAVDFLAKLPRPEFGSKSPFCLVGLDFSANSRPRFQC